MGKVPLDQVVEGSEAAVQWRAFELRPPGTPLKQRTEEERLEAERSLGRMAEQLGVPLRMPSRPMRTRLAHVGAKAAEALGRAAAYHEAVFTAVWQQDRDISDRQELCAIAAEAGIDRSAFTALLDDERLLRAVVEDEEQARRWGITGVPTFVVGRHGLVGLQTDESLRHLLAVARDD